MMRRTRILFPSSRFRRGVLAFVLAPFAVAAVPPTRDWTQTTTATPAGYYVLGNPAARIKLVEYASYTCPHCAAFSRESEPVLRARLVRSGQVSLEMRNLVRDRLDLAAVLLARCGGERSFYSASAALFAAQDDWLTRAVAYQEANALRLQMAPVPQQLRANADGAGLTGMFRARGLSDAAIAACLADQRAIDAAVARMGTIPAEVQGTPTFYINGKRVAGAVSWASLEPALRQAGAR